MLSCKEGLDALRVEILRHGWVKKVPHSIPTTNMKCTMLNTMYRIYTSEKASNVRTMYMMMVLSTRTLMC